MSISNKQTLNDMEKINTPLAEFILAERKKRDSKRVLTIEETALLSKNLKKLFIIERRIQVYLIPSPETDIHLENDNCGNVTIYVPIGTKDDTLSYLKQNKFVVKQDHNYNRWFISLPKG